MGGDTMIDLYPFQKEDVIRMEGLPYWLNANEPGTGKTYETIAELTMRRASNILIACPNSVKGTWEAAAEDHMPWLYSMTVAGPTRDKVEDYMGGFCIVNYEALRLIPLLADIEWDYVIADEAHAIKNKNAKVSKALKAIKMVGHKRALTGTPIINRPDELWSILQWLDPKSWRSYWKFYERYCDYWQAPQGYKVFQGAKNEAELWAAIAGFTSRRLKKDVLPDLPDKYYTYMPIDMHPKQAKAYKEMKKTSLAWLDQYPTKQPLPAPSVLAQLTRLRQFASGYCELKDYDPDGRSTEPFVTMTEPSTKLDALEDIMEARSGPAVVFSQFTQLVKLAAVRLSAYRVITFTGDTPQGERRGIVEAFQRGEYDAIILNIQAGGVGIDLFASSTCVFLDRAWSPAYNTQAEDRLHRNGQMNAVQVIVMQSRGTVDHYIERKLGRKASMIRDIIDREG